MSKKSLEDYKRTLTANGLAFHIEFGNADATRVMIHLISDAYMIMAMHRTPHSKMEKQIKEAVSMFTHSIKQLQPLSSDEITITEAMYSCFIRSCLPNQKFRKLESKSMEKHEAFRNWLIVAIYFQRADLLRDFIDKTPLEQCIQRSPKDPLVLHTVEGVDTEK